MTRFNTQLVHGLPVNDNNTGAVNPPIYEALDAAVSRHSAKGPAHGCPAKAVYFEVLTNPLLQVNNVTKISEIAHRYGAISSYLLLHPLVKSVHYPGLPGREYEIWTLFRKLRMR